MLPLACYLEERSPMNRRTIATVSLTVALAATACTGGGDEPQAAAPEDTVTTTVPLARTVQEPSPTTEPAPTTTTTTTVLAPSTLAFTSSADVGRLFAISEGVTASTVAGGEPDATAVSAGTIVQASSLRTRDGVLWVRIESTVAGGTTFGWVPSTLLTPTTESVFTEDRNLARQLRQVSRSVPDDALPVLANPGAGAPIAYLAEAQIAMHGGVSALSPSGDIWLDIIDPIDGTRIGWVAGRSFGAVSGGALQDDSFNDLGRSPVPDVDYGQALSGGISASGCNAVQIRFNNASSTEGIGLVFGTSSPLGRELNSGSFQWSGTSVFSEAGADVIITVPSTSTETWYFAPLDNDENAAFTSVNEDGFAVASDVVQINVPSGSCAPEPTPVETAPTLDPYIEDLLTEEEREAALAQFDAAVAEFEGGQAPPVPEEGDAAAEGEPAADGEAPAEGEAPVEGAEGDAAPEGGAEADPEADPGA